MLNVSFLSIHSLHRLSCCVTGNLKPLPGDLGHTLDRTEVYNEAQSHSDTHSHAADHFKMQISLTTHVFGLEGKTGVHRGNLPKAQIQHANT